MDPSKNMLLAAAVVQSFTSVNKMLLKFTQQNAASLGLTVMQMGILNTLYASPHITLKELSEKILAPKSTISVTVDGLVNSGMVVRESSRDDRREVNLSLSDTGLESAKVSCRNALSYRAMAEALDKLEETDIHLLLRLHTELLEQLQQLSTYL